MAIPDEVGSLRGRTVSDDGRFLLTLANDERVRARAVVIASGARYRRLDVDNLAAFEGSCVHYWASPLEARLCAGQEVALVGAGNSAGQAAVYLRSQVAKVWLIVRGAQPRSEHVALSGRPHRRQAEHRGADRDRRSPPSKGEDGVLEAIRCRSRRSGEEIRRAIRHLFLFIGADPNTDWLSGSGVTLDDKGFVRTGAQQSSGRSKPACPASSRSAMCARDRSSASPPRSARARRWWPRLHAFLAEAGGKARASCQYRETLMSDECSHGDDIRDVTPSALGCEECLKIGSPWLHLRLCRTCGHVGCCDDSPNRHATKHFHATRHPIIEGYDPPEGWGWCYVDEVMLDLSDRATPHNGPIPRYY